MFREVGVRSCRRVASLLAFVVVLSAGLLRTAEAGTVTVAWDSNRESDVAGYLVTYGERSGQLDSTVDAGNHTSYQFTNLDTGHTYFFAVRAYNTAGVMSALSAEVGATVGVATSLDNAPDSATAASEMQLALTSLYASMTSPQPAGAAVTFTALAEGGTPPYQFKWLVSASGGEWDIAKSWSASNTFSDTMDAGNYSIGVWVRSAANTTDGPENVDAGSTMNFVVTAPKVALTSLKASKPAPQLPGTSIDLTATAAGGAGLQYKWWIFNGSSWSVLENWSASNTFSWTPTAANAGYRILVRARNAANPADSAGASMSFSIVNNSTMNGRGKRKR